MTDESKMLIVSATFETWMDASRPWWRRWSTTDSVACSQAQVADLMREAWIASANIAERELSDLRAKLAAAEKDAEHWKRLYECAQNANAYRQDALDGL